MSRGEKAMVNLSDENRDLMLSLYLDGELEPDQAQAVAEKIRTDEAWQAEYVLLRSSETRITKVVEDNWHDEEFSAAVRNRLREVPPPAATVPGTPQRNRPWVLTLVALFAVCGFLIYSRSSGPRSEAPPIVPQARVADGQARIAGTPAPKGSVLSDEQELTADSGVVLLRWADGSLLWLRQGTVLSSNPNGGPAFLQGQALIQTAPGGVALWITSSGTTPGKVALRNGLFEVDFSSAGLRVQVFKGNATAGDGNTTVQAGEELKPSNLIGPADPRTLHEWRTDLQATPEGARIEWPPVWSQAGGAADHSGLTPLNGPSTLKQSRLQPIEETRLFDTVAPATLDGDGTAYLAWQSEADAVTFGRMDDQRPAAHVLANLPGRLIGSPVITPSGLVLLATNGKQLRATGKDGVAWEKDLGSTLAAITVRPNGLIVCSTFQRLVALREDGSEAWSYQGLADFQPPVALCRDGGWLALSRTGKAVFLSLEGRELPGRTLDLSDRPGPYGLPVIQQDGSVLVVGASGELLQRAASSVPTLTLPELVLTAPPLGNGTCAAGHEIVFANGTRIVSPDNEAVIALAGDGAGRLYAATQSAVHLFACGADGQTPPVLMESASVKSGQVIPGGLSIAPGRLVVTTTMGVVVFTERP